MAYIPWGSGHWLIIGSRRCCNENTMKLSEIWSFIHIWIELLCFSCCLVLPHGSYPNALPLVSLWNGAVDWTCHQQIQVWCCKIKPLCSLEAADFRSISGLNWSLFQDQMCFSGFSCDLKPLMKHDQTQDFVSCLETFALKVALIKPEMQHLGTMTRLGQSRKICWLR